MKKQSKKFVLEGLFLLVITMVLLPLADCKNDSVPETPAANLVSISVTPPARTVYSVGQSFDPTGMVVTATYDDEEPKDVTSLATTDFDTVAGVKGLNKTVTVNYTEGETTKTTTFTVTVFPAEVKVLTELEYTSPNNTGSEWTYVEFGEWPQTIKEKGVEIGAGTLAGVASPTTWAATATTAWNRKKMPMGVELRTSTAIESRRDKVAPSPSGSRWSRLCGVC